MRALPALVTAAALAACGARGAVPLQNGPAAPSAERAPSPIGATWTNIGGNALAGSFEGVDWDGGNLFVATDGQGVIYSQAPAK